MIIPLRQKLLPVFQRSTRTLHTGRAQTCSYLILLRAEFGCFHSGSSPEGSRSPLPAQCPGHSLCSTGPRLTTDGNYPLRYHTESGLSSSPPLGGTPRSSANPGIYNTPGKPSTRDNLRHVREFLPTLHATGIKSDPDFPIGKGACFQGVEDSVSIRNKQNVSEKGFKMNRQFFTLAMITLGALMLAYQNFSFLN